MMTNERAILAVALFAAFADGSKHDREREHIREIAESLGEGNSGLTGLYQDVLLKRIRLEDAIAALSDAGARQLAYETALGVCEADGRMSDPQRAFLERHRSALALDAASASEVEGEAEAMAGLADDAAPASLPAAVAGPVVAADVVLFGLGKPATGPYVPDTWPYNPHVKTYEYDLQKARELPREAGWKDTDGDGILDKGGRPFAFTILTNMGNSLRMNAATIIRWKLAKIGINVDIRVLEWSTFVNEFIDKRRFQAVILGWSIGFDPDQYDIWHSSKTKEKEFNFISYSNPEVDALLDRGRRTFDIGGRKKAYFRIQEILAEEVPYIFLYVPDATPIVHARFRGIKPSPIGISYNLPKWYVPKKLQRHSMEP